MSCDATPHSRPPTNIARARAPKGGGATSSLNALQVLSLFSREQHSALGCHATPHYRRASTDHGGDMQGTGIRDHHVPTKPHPFPIHREHSHCGGDQLHAFFPSPEHAKIRPGGRSQIEVPRRPVGAGDPWEWDRGAPNIESDRAITSLVQRLQETESTLSRWRAVDGVTPTSSSDMTVTSVVLISVSVLLLPLLLLLAARL